MILKLFFQGVLIAYIMFKFREIQQLLVNKNMKTITDWNKVHVISHYMQPSYGQPTRTKAVSYIFLVQLSNS